MFMKKVFVLAVFITFFLPQLSIGARLSEPEELDKIISKINERQSRNIKQFEKKAKAYFFEAQKPELIEALVKEFPPGDSVTLIVFSNLSKKPALDIATMRKSGMNWQTIAAKLQLNLKAAVKEVKDFRLGIG